MEKAIFAGNVVWEYKDVRYKVIGFVQVKDPHTREWFLAIQYNSLDNPVQYPYVRKASEFHEMFEYVGCLNEKGKLIELSDRF